MKTCFKCKHYTEPWCNALGHPITIEFPDVAAETCHGFYDEDPNKDGLQTYCRQCTSDAMKKARIKKVAKPLNPSESGSSDLCFIRTEDLLSELKRRGFSGYLKRVEEFSI